MKHEEHLTEAERTRVQEMLDQIKAFSRERRRIYDRARKRAGRGFKAKTEGV